MLRVSHHSAQGSDPFQPHQGSRRAYSGQQISIMGRVRVRARATARVRVRISRLLALTVYTP